MSDFKRLMEIYKQGQCSHPLLGVIRQLRDLEIPAEYAIPESIFENLSAIVAATGPPTAPVDL